MSSGVIAGDEHVAIRRARAARIDLARSRRIARRERTDRR
jgi:hypothetical protein